MRKLYAVILSTCFVLLFSNIRAQVISQLSFYSPLISTFDMKYSNNHLVVAQNGLLIFDVTNPTQKPKLVAQTTYPGSSARAVAVQGNYAYMAFGNNGILAVYDISNFSSPVLKGSVAIPAVAFYFYGDAEAYGNYVYLSGFDSLYVVDVSNAASPFVANVLPVAHNDFNGAESMAIEGQSLFIKTSVSVEVYNISNPVSPALVASINYMHAYNNEVVTDTVNHRLFLSWATVLKDFTGYDAYDVSNPSSPVYLFSDSTAFSPGDFGIMDYSYHDNVLFASRGGSINAFDVSANPHFVTNFSGQDIPNASVSIQVRDSVFFHARGGGLEVLKYGTATEPVCAAPESLKQNVNGTSAYLYWNKVDGAVGYVVSYREIGTHDWKVKTSKDNMQKLTNLQPGTAYTWQVKTVCSTMPAKASDWSLYNVFYVRATDISSLISFAPNPVKAVMHVHIKEASVAQIMITDLAGKPLLKIRVTGTDENISLSMLHPGAYLVQLNNKNNSVIGTTKIIKE